MKKKLLALVTALVVFSGSAVFHVSADALFERKHSYTPSVFADIVESDWFYTEIANCYELGLVSGDGSGCFYPYELISRAEVISIAARVHSAYEKDAHVFAASEGESWYTPYITYALENKIITAEDFDADYMQPASRCEVAYIYANALPYTEFKNINTSIHAVPDVEDTDDYYNQIIMLYRAGVVTGKDNSGRFSPKEYISRAEAAAILNRVADVSQRISFTLPETTEQTDAAQTETSSAFSAVEIASQCSPAVFYIEIYDARGNAYASGSGFFISEDGVAVTNYHVIEEAYSAKIRLIDGTEYTVSGIRAYDRENDLAIIQVDGTGFAYLSMGDSDALQNGQTIYCVGSPLGLENTISEGIVSNANRVYDGVTYIQISAPISSGSSGGAVLDNTGKVIGVSSAGFEDGQNLNLAMPINLVKTMGTDTVMTFAAFQAGSTGTQSGSQTVSINTPTASAGYYADNPHIPDFGYVTGMTQTDYEMYAEDGIVMRKYGYDSAAYEGYLRVMMQCGFTVAQRDSDSTSVTVYMQSGENVIAISAEPYSNAISILYYVEGKTQTVESTYPNTSIPDYSIITGRRLRNKIALTDAEGYIYCYSYSYIDLQLYIAALEQQGYTYYDSGRMDSGTVHFYAKGEELVGVYANLFLNEIWIIA